MNAHPPFFHIFMIYSIFLFPPPSQCPPLLKYIIASFVAFVNAHTINAVSFGSTRSPLGTTEAYFPDPISEGGSTMSACSHVNIL